MPETKTKDLIQEIIDKLLVFAIDGYTNTINEHLISVLYGLREIQKIMNKED